MKEGKKGLAINFTSQPVMQTRGVELGEFWSTCSQWHVQQIALVKWKLVATATR